MRSISLGLYLAPSVVVDGYHIIAYACVLLHEGTMFIEALKGTPWWVYILFIYLVITGVKTLKPRVVSLKNIFILPSVFIAWSFYTLSTKLNTSLDIGIWSASLILGVLIGWRLTRSLKIKADKKKALIATPGGWLTFILIFLIFATKYFFGYSYATNSAAVENFFFVMADLISSGVITGMFLGKAFCLCLKWKASEHSDLS